MGFYIRKSVRVGPFRFNLSNSGIGVSAGIRGLRVGSGPRGTYVHMGSNGLYYRQTLTSSAGRPQPNPKSPSVASYSPSWTHGPMYSIGSGAVSDMVDSNFAELLEEIETRRSRIVLWPIMLAATILFAAFLFINQTPLWAQITCLLPLAVGTMVISQRDRLRKTVVLMYDLEEMGLDNYKNLHAAIDEITNCGGVWHITAQGDVYNRKYHAGARGLINRRAFSLTYRNPPWIRTNLSVPSLSFNDLTLYLLPDLILAHAPNGYGAIDYASLTFDARPTRFIEEQSVPQDAVVVDHTWRYVNKDGGPDRRFNNNRQIPICQYEELRISSSTGIHELLQFSRCGVSVRLQAVVAELAVGIRKAIAQAELIEQKRIEERRLLESTPALALENTLRDVLPPPPRSMHSVLFDLLCCMMAADGRVSSAEISKINQIMDKIRPGWTEDHCRTRINSFVNDVKTRGYVSMLEQAMSHLPMFKQQGRQRTLMKCMEAVANADGIHSDRERNLLDRIRGSLAD